MGSLFTVATDILTVATVAATNDGAGAPGVAFVCNGKLAWDQCCDGLLAVIPGRVYGSTQFPRPNITDPTRCWDGAAVDFAVVILRCAPTVDSKGRGPTPEAIQASAGQTMDDAQAIFRALQCFAGDYPDDVFVRETLWIGPEGGCVGSQTNIVVELPFSTPAAPPDPDPGYAGGYAGGY